jgi:enhancing lycopene biosynthesis protein 2
MKRNVLFESARITRGNIKEIRNLNSSNYDALFVPGGFGVAKNLSDFGSKGKEMTVHAEVERVLKDFHANKKQIGMCCIAPILAAKVFGTTRDGGPGVTITLGSKGDISSWPY